MNDAGQAPLRRVPKSRRRVAIVLGAGMLAVLPLVADPAAAVTFSNPAPVQGQFAGNLKMFADPYPSNISVSGLTNNVNDVNVTLCGFSATFPSDLDLMLVAPGNAQAMILSDVGGNGEDNPDIPGIDVPVSNVNLTLDDQAGSPLPGGPTLVSGTFRPIDDDDELDDFPSADPTSMPNIDTFAIPAPPLGPNVALSSFNGISPNGTWSLYFIDDYPAQPSDGEFVYPNLSCGWSLNITTGAPQTTTTGGPTTTSAPTTTTTMGPTTTTTTPAVDPAPPADFDGDGDSDVSVFRPGSTATWFVRNGVTTDWGTSGDIPTPGDYNGDGSTNIAVFRPSTGVWHHRTGLSAAWGGSGDIPVPADYDGNVSTDRAVFRPSTGVWYVQGGATVAWGSSGDVPVPGDYDGNGSDDIAVFRPSSSTWFVRGGTTTAWGTSGDVPVPGDYDGNGTTDIAVFRPSTGTWYVRNGVTAAWGTSGDIPAPGDYDGNGTIDRAVFRPSTGTWFVQGGVSVAFGTSGDHPLPLPSAVRQVYFP